MCLLKKHVSRIFQNVCLLVRFVGKFSVRDMESPALKFIRQSSTSPAAVLTIQELTGTNTGISISFGITNSLAPLQLLSSLDPVCKREKCGHAKNEALLSSITFVSKLTLKRFFCHYSHLPQGWKEQGSKLSQQMPSGKWVVCDSTQVHMEPNQYTSVKYINQFIMAKKLVEASH